MFLNPNYFFHIWILIFSNLLVLRNIQQQVKKAFCYQKLFWPFSVWANCSNDHKIFANSWPSAMIFKSFSRLLRQFFLTVGQSSFGNKIPIVSSLFFLFFAYLIDSKNIYVTMFRYSEKVTKIWLIFHICLDITQ